MAGVDGRVAGFLGGGGGVVGDKGEGAKGPGKGEFKTREKTFVYKKDKGRVRGKKGKE